MKGLIDGLLLFLNSGQIGDYSRSLVDNVIKYKDYDLKIVKDYEINSVNYQNIYAEIFLDRINDNYNGLIQYINNNDISFYHCLNNGFSIPKNLDFNYIMNISNLMPLIFDKYCTVNYNNAFFSKFPYSVMKSDYIICPSVSTKKDFLNNFSVNENNVFVSYGFVSDFYNKADKFMSSIYVKSKFNIEFKYIIFYGDFNRRKRLDKALMLFSQIKKEFNNLHFLICSDNLADESYYNELVNMCNKLHITNHVHFIENISLLDKVNLYNNALFFIDLSEYECTNLNIVEAYKCEIPIVCSRIDLYIEYFGENVLYYNDKINYTCVINYIYKYVYSNDEFVFNKFDKYVNLEVIDMIYNKLNC